MFPASVAHISSLHDNCGASFDHATALVGLRSALGAPADHVAEAVTWVRDVGVALFRRGMLEREDHVTASIAGRAVDVPGGPSYWNSAPRWADAVGAALSLRDEDALVQLCAFPADGFLGSYARYHDTYARAVMAALAGDLSGRDLFLESVEQAERADTFPIRGRLYGAPLARLALAVLAGDQAEYTVRLTEGLEAFATLYGQGQDRQDPRGVVPLRYVGWCARAHDAGLTLEVESDYLPPYLVEGLAS